MFNFVGDCRNSGGIGVGLEVDSYYLLILLGWILCCVIVEGLFGRVLGFVLVVLFGV